MLFMALNSKWKDRKLTCDAGSKTNETTHHSHVSVYIVALPVKPRVGPALHRTCNVCLGLRSLVNRNAGNPKAQKLNYITSKTRRARVWHF